MDSLLEKAVASIDAANSADPHRVIIDGRDEAKEVVYARQMTGWLFRLEKNPGEVLQLAARAQHICRWEIARATYPAGRIGYLQWRTTLSAFHADKAGQILRDVGYDPAIIEGVEKLLRKQGIKSDPDMQTLEDVICLVFLENELEAFMQQHADEKVIDILRKTWRKMSERGHAAAVALLPSLPEKTQQAMQRALQ